MKPETPFKLPIVELPEEAKGSVWKRLLPKNPLDIIFVITILAWLLVGFALVSTYALCFNQGTGCGDMFLFAFPIIAVACILSVIYPPVSIIYLLVRLIGGKGFAVRYLITALLVGALCFIPVFGPVWIARSFTENQKALDKIQAQASAEKNTFMAEYRKRGGPAEEDIAKLELGTFDDVQSRIDSCNVVVVNYDKISFLGPVEPKNMYINVAMMDHDGKVTGVDDVPPDINLPFSDEAKIEDAVKNKNSHLSGQYESCKVKIMRGTDVR